MCVFQLAILESCSVDLKCKGSQELKLCPSFPLLFFLLQNEKESSMRDLYDE